MGIMQVSTIQMTFGALLNKFMESLYVVVCQKNASDTPLRFNQSYCKVLFFMIIWNKIEINLSIFKRNIYNHYFYDGIIYNLYSYVNLFNFFIVFVQAYLLF